MRGRGRTGGRGRRTIQTSAQPSRGVCTEPLEERLLCAMSRAAGGSGLSGTLSTNPAIRQQQLICDPASDGNAPLLGSTSVSYDAAVVTLSSVQAGPGYRNEEVLVEVRPVVIEGPPAGTELIPFSQFDDSRGSFIETGYVQVKYQLAGDPGVMSPPDGFTQNDSAGVDGFDTHALFFSPLVVINSPNDSVGLSLTAAAVVEPPSEGLSYTVFAAAPGTHSGNEEDFFKDPSGKIIHFNEISPAVVSTTPINVKPVAAMTAPAETSNGPVDVTLLATDPSPSDTAAGFTYLIDWGDGTTGTVAATAFNGSGAPAHHDYKDVGTFTITLRAVDQHGQTSDPFATQVHIGGAELRPDPVDPTKLGLVVNGTGGNDVIGVLEVCDRAWVRINNKSFGPFTGYQRIIVRAGAGNDLVGVVDSGSHPVLMFGGAGNDAMAAWAGNAVLSGGDGNDLLSGGAGNDVVIGGRGSDLLYGGAGQDIVVAGATAYDNGTDDDVRALSGILAEWNRPLTYETRISHISGTAPGGVNGAAQFRASGPTRNVFDDGATDLVFGGAGRDWLLFHRGAGGDIADLALNETGSQI
jgi:Ca2+-binding RTX toxin-like protein